MFEPRNVFRWNAAVEASLQQNIELPHIKQIKSRNQRVENRFPMHIRFICVKNIVSRKSAKNCVKVYSRRMHRKKSNTF